ncbi:MAG: hypothetical protein ACLP6G_04375 [Terriglobales bacterium]
MKHILTALFIVLSCFTALAQDRPSGPFGFERGMTRTQILKIVGESVVDRKASRDDVLVLSTAPRPNPAFETYALFISPTQGLLKVVAFSATVQTGDTGRELQDAFAAINTAVSQKYGTAKLYDQCDGDDTECSQPGFWMMALKDKNRSLNAFWDLRAQPAGNYVTMIEETSLFLSMHSGYVKIGFEFQGWEQYVDAVHAKQDAAY